MCDWMRTPAVGEINVAVIMNEEVWEAADEYCKHEKTYDRNSKIRSD